MRSIKFYTTAGGRCPVGDFLDSLSDPDARKVTWILRLVERLDIVPSQYFKKLAGPEDIWEIRVQTRGIAVRILGFFDEGNLLVLTSGFSKKHRKIPEHELSLANQRRHDYLSRRKS
jgi:phage-related protein